MDPAGPSLGLVELRAALASPDPAVRARAIAKIRAEPGVQEALIEALRDAYADVRRAAVRALARLQEPMATRVLIQISMEDLSVSVRAEAVAALGRIVEARSKIEGGTSEGQAPTD
jgi:HEAT repeat protein